MAGVIISTAAGWPGENYKRNNLIAVNLPLRPGNSEGPLVDFSGRVVGINSLIAGPDVRIAVPVHTVKAFLIKALGSRKPAAVLRLNPSLIQSQWFVPNSAKYQLIQRQSLPGPHLPLLQILGQVLQVTLVAHGPRRHGPILLGNAECLHHLLR